MAEYDNRNRGALFPPYEDQSMILSGRLNIEGENGYFAVIRRVTNDGKPILDLYQKVGVLLPQEQQSEQSPTYTGPLDRYPDRRLAAWKKEKDGMKYLSIAISERQRVRGQPIASQARDGRQPAPWQQLDRPSSVLDEIDDEIPF
jgi:hypothetical protein